MGRDIDHVRRRGTDMEAEGRGRRRPKRIWKDRIANEMNAIKLNAEVNDRTRWRKLVRNSDPI